MTRETGVRTRQRAVVRALVGVSLCLSLVALLGGCAAAVKPGTKKSATGSEDSSKSIDAAIQTYNEGDFAGAEKALTKIVKEHPGNLEARKALALALAAQGKNELAIKQYMAVIEADAKDHATLYRLALLERLTGDVESAAGHLKAAVELNPDDSYADELARTYVQLGKYKEATDIWGSLIAEKGRPNDSTVALLKLQAEAYSLAGDTKAARTALKHAASLAPGDVDIEARLKALGE